ncbi:hypothetical protein N9424_03320 [Gammaproteobacteria bacterium]|nr:hypothetical protein [Gammaproteobacteria bacterium]
MKSIWDDWLSIIIIGSFSVLVGYYLYQYGKVDGANEAEAKALQECIDMHNIRMNIEDADTNIDGIQISDADIIVNKYVEQITRLCLELDEEKQEIMIQKMKELQDK